MLSSVPASCTPSVTLEFGAAHGLEVARPPGIEDGALPGCPLAGRDAGRLGSEGVEGVGAAGRFSALGLCRRAALPDCGLRTGCAGLAGHATDRGGSSSRVEEVPAGTPLPPVPPAAWLGEQGACSERCRIEGVRARLAACCVQGLERAVRVVVGCELRLTTPTGLGRAADAATVSTPPDVAATAAAGTGAGVAAAAAVAAGAGAGIGAAMGVVPAAGIAVAAVAAASVGADAATAAPAATAWPIASPIEVTQDSFPMQDFTTSTCPLSKLRATPSTCPLPNTGV